MNDYNESNNLIRRIEKHLPIIAGLGRIASGILKTILVTIYKNKQHEFNTYGGKTMVWNYNTNTRLTYGTD